MALIEFLSQHTKILTIQSHLMYSSADKLFVVKVQFS
jgi:hypothetical protein